MRISQGESLGNPLRSPLRFPGGKVFLCDYMERFLNLNSLQPSLFVEPFAGGASVSLHLLGKGMVDKIALFDRDPLVASFWQTIFYNGTWLKKKILKTDITLEEWIKHQNSPLNGDRENAWKCLFLNRTSFSGIISSTAGPLGGKSQNSRFKIDCRFYRQTLVDRIKELSKYNNKVEKVAQADWKDTIKHFEFLPKAQRKGVFLYLDPPFFHKAERLYNYYFTSADHETLIDRLSKTGLPWLLSYDDCPEVIFLLKKYRLHYTRVPVRYSSAVNNSRGVKKEIVSSNLLLPRGNKKCQ